MSTGWLSATQSTVVPRSGTTFIASRITNTQGYLTVPAFSLAIANPLSHRRRVAQYNYIADKAFSFKTKILSTQFTGGMVCLVWRKGAWKARFQCWEDSRYPFLVYNNDVIHRYFSVEFWSHPLSSLVSLPNDLTLYTSQYYSNDQMLPGNKGTSGVTTSLVSSSDLILPFDGGGKVPWGTVQNANGPWLDNEGTWNELSAGSENRASELFPAGWF